MDATTKVEPLPTAADAAAEKSPGLIALAAHSVFDWLMRSGTFGQAERDNRRLDRDAKREAKHAAYHRAGLNGHRAVNRRARQRMYGCNDQSRGFVGLRIREAV